MSRLLQIALMSGAAALGAGGAVPREVSAPPAPVVREIADPLLRDVAIAIYDSAHPVIYYNPSLLRQLGPELEAFFLAHERAHIELRHTRASALRAEPGQRDSLLQAKELEADCLAARRLGSARTGATMAAVHFFARLRDTHFDDEHPTGTARAARILACMP